MLAKKLFPSQKKQEFAVVKKKIWLSLATMSGHEMKYIQEAFDLNWVAPLGPNVDAFELQLRDFLFPNPNGYVVALNTGTAALHLAMLQLGIKRGDEVICQSLTFAASANAIRYLDATPVFIDSEDQTWNLDPELVEKAIIERFQLIGEYPKAIITVNLYGMPAQYDRLKKISQKYNIPIIEDAAESLGSSYKGVKCGTISDFGVVSFNGNKIITTSGGGALICKSEKTARKTLFYATQAREDLPYYQHEEVGYNYRMSNVSAGIGRGQLIGLPSFIEKRRYNHRFYTRLLGNVPGISIHHNPSADYDSNYWLTCILIDEKLYGMGSEQLRMIFENENIEVRPIWKPMHLQPVYTLMPFYGNGTSERLFKNGLCLPSGCGLTDDDLQRVADVILSHAKQ